MHTNNIFSLKRLATLIKLDFATNYKTILTTTVAIASILFLYFLASPEHNLDNNFHAGPYAILLFAGGFWATSLAFKDMHDVGKNYILLTLPCSNLEKFLDKLLLTSVGYAVAVTAGFFLLSLIMNAITITLFHYRQPIFNPLQPNILLYVREYIAIQSLFLLGSIYFKNHAMSKIVLSIFCIIIIVAVFTSLISYLFLRPYDFINFHWFVSFSDIAKASFWLILAPFCWLITYLRLAETEI